MVSGLLLIAFGFFVFARAAVLRGSGQSAADAAALAAAQEARDHLFDDFLEALEDHEDEEELNDTLAAEDFAVGSACGEAAPRLAGQNNADVVSCTADEERRGYTVAIVTRDTVGDSVIPGTEDQQASLAATAVIHGLCEAESASATRVELSCEDQDWSFDPGDEDNIPEARDLFRVYLDD